VLIAIIQLSGRNMDYSIKDHQVNSSTANIIVPWWSFSKTVIASVILLLVEEGKLDLSAKYYDLSATLLQLLSHESGLKDYADLKEYQTAVALKEEPWTFKEMLTRTGADELLFEPGSGWSYSNIGYAYLKQLIEETTGLTLDQAINDMIFSKIDIKDVHVVSEFADIKYCAYIAKGYHPRWVYHGLVTGSLRSAAVFLDKLVLGEIISKGSLELMKNPYLMKANDEESSWKEPAYGLGIMLDLQVGNLNCYGHTGIGPGSMIGVYHFPDGKLSMTVAVSVNSVDEVALEQAVIKIAKDNQ
jgi:CubicO group peptidase (beta-lactamase class C family)